MKYLPLGSSNLRVSELALGAMSFGSPNWRSWVLDGDAARPVLERALERGINFIDTCDFYSGGESELLLGRLLAEFGVKQDVVVATKLGNPMGDGPNHKGYSRKHIFEAVDASLKRLNTERIDLLQTHIWDASTNVEEMMAAFDTLVRQGKVLYIGATDIPCWQFARSMMYARSHGLTQFVSLQHHYNALWREDERDLVPFCLAEGIGLLPYSPLARGLLAGKKRRVNTSTERARTDEYASIWYGRPEDTTLIEEVEALSDRLGVPAAAVAIAWVKAKQPKSIPVFGATQVDHIDDAVEALSFSLATSDVQAIDKAYRSRCHGGHF